jgi:hypothetical protein
MAVFGKKQCFHKDIKRVRPCFPSKCARRLTSLMPEPLKIVKL